MAIATFSRGIVRRGDLVDGARVFKNADTELHRHLGGLARARRTPYLVKLGQEGAHLRLDLGTAAQSRGGPPNPNPFTGDKSGFSGVGRLIAVCETATQAYEWARTHFPSATIKQHGRFPELLAKERASLKPRPVTPKPPPPDGLLGHAEHLLQVVPQIILQGPPGTGKTYNAKRLAAHLLGIDPAFVAEEESKATGQFHAAHFPGVDAGCWELVQVHPAYAYEDFVRGIQAETEEGSISYKVVRRVLDRLVEHHRDDATTVLIIDEINRANLAQVLGELIYGLEYRGSAVETPYQSRTTGPAAGPWQFHEVNFSSSAFLQLNPNAEVIRQQNVPTADKAWAEAVFESVGDLFGSAAGGDSGYLAQEFHPDDVRVGHSYFLGPRSDVKIKFAYQVYPLLREYYKDGVLLAQNGKIEFTLPGGDTLDLTQPIDPENLLSKLD